MNSPEPARPAPNSSPVRRIAVAVILSGLVFAGLWIMVFSVVTSLLIGAGSLVTFAVGPGGDITGIFSNGSSRLLGQMAVALFTNAGGLSRAGSNNFEAKTCRAMRSGSKNG